MIHAHFNKVVAKGLAHRSSWGSHAMRVAKVPLVVVGLFLEFPLTILTVIYVLVKLISLKNNPKQTANFIYRYLHF